MGWEGEKSLRLVKGKGCSSCYDSGYKGRQGIYELLEVESGLKAVILRNPSVKEIRQYQQKTGISTLMQEGLQKARERQTTIEEVMRAVYVE